MRSLVMFGLERLAYGLLSLALISVLIFAATQVVPGDTARAILGLDASPEQLAAVRAELLLDRPAHEQYVHWLRGIVSGDLGTSFVTRVPVAELFIVRGRNTAVLTLLVLAIGVPIALTIGALSAWWRDRRFDHFMSITTLLLFALPPFAVGIAIVWLLATNVFHLFPGVTILPTNTPPWHYPSQLVLPTLTLVLIIIPHIARVMRASMIEVLESDYIELARLKGMPERRVLWRHALRNGLAPSFQVTAATGGALVGGIVVIEYIFNYPGIGAAFVDAVHQSDIPVVQLFSLTIAGVYLFFNMLADAGTILVSPRLRTASK